MATGVFERCVICASAFAGLLFANAAAADCGGAFPNGACSNVQITLLYIDANAHAWLSVSGNMSALPCTLTSGNLVQLPNTSANFKAVCVTLLAAHMSGRVVNVRIDPNASACTVAYVTVP